MSGSERGAFEGESGLAGARIFSIRLLGRTLWGWQRQDALGEVVAYSRTFFGDYLSCLFDAQRATAQ